MTPLSGKEAVVDYDGERARLLRIEANTAIANGLIIRSKRLFAQADALDRAAGR